LARKLDIAQNAAISLNFVDRDKWYTAVRHIRYFNLGNPGTPEAVGCLISNKNDIREKKLFSLESFANTLD
jgi:hypothetical protein